MAALRESSGGFFLRFLYNLYINVLFPVCPRFFFLLCYSFTLVPQLRLEPVIKKKTNKKLFFFTENVTNECDFIF